MLVFFKFVCILLIVEYIWLQVSAERQLQKQEKTVAQQAKREQLKRLHRAQVLILTAVAYCILPTLAGVECLFYCCCFFFTLCTIEKVNHLF